MDIKRERDCNFITDLTLGLVETLSEFISRLCFFDDLTADFASVCIFQREYLHKWYVHAEIYPRWVFTFCFMIFPRIILKDMITYVFI